MKPIAGQYVRCLFKSGLSIDGVVEEWSANEASLTSLTDESTILILHPEEDIMIVKIIPPETIQAKIDDVSNEFPTFQEVVDRNANPFDDARNKTIAELKQQMADQEKKIIANKLKQHIPSQVRRPNYGNPFTKQKPK